MTNVISYDLNKPGQDYQDLYAEIKRLGSWCHPLDSTWFVVSSLTAETIRNRLISVMDQSDSLIVARASAPAAWNGLSQKLSDWLRNNL
jgi:hypothetical protein